MRNYQYNNEFPSRYENTKYLLTKADLYYYTGNLQFNAKANYFTASQDGQSNILRTKAQICYYISETGDYGTEDYVPPLRLQLTYNFNNMNRLQDHQIFFDYEANLVKPSMGYNFLSGNGIVGWTLNRREFIYGFSAKGSFFIRGNISNILKDIGYGYSITRSKINGNDHWGNFKVQIFSVIGPRYAGFSSLITASYAREIYNRFNNWEFGLVIRNPYTQRVKRGGKYESTKIRK